jgi:ComF family protein
MQLLERIVRVFAPHTCVGCGAEQDLLLCEGCRQSLAPVPSRCYRCKAVTAAYAVCRECRPRTALRQVVVYAHHTGLAKELVHRMKYERAVSGIAEAAELLAERLPDLPDDVVFVHVPTATSRVRTRGYDHAALLARQLGRLHGAPVRTLLARVGQAHQVGASRAERLRQLQGAFRAVRLETIVGRHIVLVDDVLTTGATLEIAARVLKKAGAAKVDAVVFAQA